MASEFQVEFENLTPDWFVVAARESLRLQALARHFAKNDAEPGAVDDHSIDNGSEACASELNGDVLVAQLRPQSGEGGGDVGGNDLGRGSD